MRFIFRGIAGAVLLLCACGPFTGDPFTGDSEVGLCDSLHGVLGSQSLTAVASGDEPMLTSSSPRYSIALVPVTDGNGGRLGLQAAGARRSYFFMSDVPLSIEDATGALVTVEECPAGIVECPGRTRSATRPSSQPGAAICSSGRPQRLA